MHQLRERLSSHPPTRVLCRRGLACPWPNPSFGFDSLRADVLSAGALVCACGRAPKAALSVGGVACAPLSSRCELGAAHAERGAPRTQPPLHAAPTDGDATHAAHSL
eukprot:6204977-Pleurochrysis_carterae.AAC.5